MSQDELKIFVSFERDEEGKVCKMQTAPNQEKAENFPQYDAKDENYKFLEFKSSEKLADKDLDINKTVGIDDICYATMQKCESVLSPYHNLIELVLHFRSGLQAAGVTTQLYKFSKESGRQVRQDKKIETFELTIEQFKELEKNITHVHEVDEGLALLPSSILMSMVASFDSILADFTKDFLTNNPEKLESRDKTITFGQLFSIADISELRARIIDDEVDKFLRGSHTEQAKYLEKIIDTDIIKPYNRWPDFYEIFERRNRYAHAGGLCNEEYLSRVKDSGYKISEIEPGQKLPLGAKYLHNAVDCLIEFGTLCAFITWRKMTSNVEMPFNSISDAAYHYITKRRYRIAIWLLDFALHKQSRKGVSDAQIRRMVINLANAYKKSENAEMCKKTLASMDWSAVSKDFTLSCAALHEDAEKFCETLPLAVASGDIGAEHIKEWPVFDWLRDNHDVRRKLNELFGEEFLPLVTAEPQDMPAELPDKEDEKTFH